MKKQLVIIAMAGILAAFTGCGKDDTSDTSVIAAGSGSKTSTTTTAQNATTAVSGTTVNGTAVANSQTTNSDGRLFGGYVATESDALNLRSEPNINASVIAQIPSGTQISVYPCDTNGWYKVDFAGKIGYASAEFIKEIEADYALYDNENKNKYGFYPVTEQPQTSISVGDLIGTWHDDSDTLTFYNCSWNAGEFDWYQTGKYIHGIVRLEYSVNPDGTHETWYNLYGNSNEYLIGFHTESGIQLTDIYAGHNRNPHYTRPLEPDCSNPTAGIEASDYIGTWGTDRCVITISQNGSSYVANVEWASGVGATLKHTKWTYNLTYDDSQATMACYDGGTCIEREDFGDGTYTETTRYTDGGATFAMREGVLRWLDHKEDVANGMEFFR